MTPEQLIKIIIIFFYAVILHECAHGWVAYKLGDSTAKVSGRLTLNPIRHVDPIGTIVLPALLFLLPSPIIFGWAKPVPVNFLALRHPKRDMMLVALAGPLVNIFLAVLLSFLFKGNFSSGDHQVLQMAVEINLVLALFNMIPIPPLDGSRVVIGLLPAKMAYAYARLERYGIVIVFVLLYFGLLNRVVWPMVEFFEHLLGIN